MSKILWSSLLISPAILSATLILSGRAIATDKQVVSEVNQLQTAGENINEAPSTAIASAAETVSVDSVAELSTSASTLKNQTQAAQPSQPVSVAQAVPVNAQVADSAPVDTSNLQQILRYGNEGGGNSNNSTSLDQITNVSQFRDVQPSDWAYEALARVVERYGCLQGYPDGTYRGNRALSRYEFAAGLNACLRQIEALIEQNRGTQGGVSTEDFQALQRLTEEFRTELATLGTRVDNLEGRTAFLEQRQFSTTTKLAGEAIFALTDTLDSHPNSTVLGDRVRLDLRTSFTGRDTLHTRLAAGNLTGPNQPGGFNYPFEVGNPNTRPDTFEGTQTFNLAPGSAPLSNDIRLDWLSYYAPFVGGSKLYLAATGGIHSDYAATNNPYFEDYDGGNGALSTFAQESPIYRIGGGAGGAITLGFGGGGGLLRPSGLTVGYLADTPNNPFGDNGIFRGSYAALGQLNFNVSDRIGLGLTYVHGYHYGGDSIFDLGGEPDFATPRGVVGTSYANNPRSVIPGTGNAPMSTNSYGASLAFRPTNAFSISGFVTKTSARVLDPNATTNVDADIWSYGAGLAFPNFGKEGNVLGFFAGVEPTVRSIRGAANTLPDTENAYHLEGFYKYQLTDNISVTPGVIWLTNPGQTTATEDVVIGTLRTTFTF